MPSHLNSSYLAPVHSLLLATPCCLFSYLLTCTCFCTCCEENHRYWSSDLKDLYYTSKLGEHFGDGGQTIVAVGLHRSGLPAPAPLPSQAAMVVGHWTDYVVTVGDPEPLNCFHSCFAMLTVPLPSLTWLWEPDSVGVEESLALEFSTQPNRCSQSPWRPSRRGGRQSVGPPWSPFLSVWTCS